MYCHFSPGFLGGSKICKKCNFLFYNLCHNSYTSCLHILEKKEVHDMISVDPLTKIVRFIVQDLTLEWKYIFNLSIWENLDSWQRCSLCPIHVRKLWNPWFLGVRILSFIAGQKSFIENVFYLRRSSLLSRRRKQIKWMVMVSIKPST